jgi:hypothetical protein
MLVEERRNHDYIQNYKTIWCHAVLTTYFNLQLRFYVPGRQERSTDVSRAV